MKPITLSTIHKFSPEQVFEYIAVCMLGQNDKSLSKKSNDVICAYRGDHGKRCAAGFCMSDDEYLKEMEGQSIDLVLREFSVDFRNAMPVLIKMQGLHDDSDPSEWPLKIKESCMEMFNVDFTLDFGWVEAKLLECHTSEEIKFLIEIVDQLWRSNNISLDDGCWPKIASSVAKQKTYVDSLRKGNEVS